MWIVSNAGGGFAGISPSRLTLMITRRARTGMTGATAGLSMRKMGVFFAPSVTERSRDNGLDEVR